MQVCPALRNVNDIAPSTAASIATQPALPFTDIVSMLGLPKSSAHGLCAMLLKLGLLNRTDAGVYRLGPHTMNWANGFLRQTDLVEGFQRLLQECRELSNFTVTLTILDKIQVVYLACCSNSDVALGFTFMIGMRLPAPFTATGKAMLSTLEDEDIWRRFDVQWPHILTVHSVGMIDALLQELTVARQRGFSVDNGQTRDGMFCIGAPVYNFSGQVVAGMAVNILEQETTAFAIGALGCTLVDISMSLSSRWGHCKSLQLK